MILHIIETDEYFEMLLKVYYVDFKNQKVTVNKVSIIWVEDGKDSIILYE